MLINYINFHFIKKDNNIQKSPNCVKNDPCDVIKIREMRVEEGEKTPKKEMDIPSFL